jgi:hypothetical protein
LTKIKIYDRDSFKEIPPDVHRIFQSLKDYGCGVEVGIHGGVGGPVSENDDVAGESDGESGEDGGVGWLERVISLCPYVTNSSFELFLGAGANRIAVLGFIASVESHST